MGRRHLIVAAALVAALTSAIPAGAAIVWSELSRGTGTGSVGAPVGYVAYSRGQAASFAARIPGAKARVWTVNFQKTTIVAVLGEFGCADPRISVASITQQSSSLLVVLKKYPLAKGRTECSALFPTYRLLEIGRSALHRPLPTHVSVRLVSA
ncbi:MAG: hypothetical protein JO186_12410 [Actinobacteria bacterium]|nr:hypothetical protein [Actinomycetota bacterium]MBV8395812.1 hypothetical protein [Actinomycetota bacterium]MBV8599621.1 hypothetical protein [Actinomycetota bacterium]